MHHEWTNQPPGDKLITSQRFFFTRIDRFSGFGFAFAALRSSGIFASRGMPYSHWCSPTKHHLFLRNNFTANKVWQCTYAHRIHWSSHVVHDPAAADSLGNWNVLTVPERRPPGGSGCRLSGCRTGQNMVPFRPVRMHGPRSKGVGESASYTLSRLHAITVFTALALLLHSLDFDGWRHPTWTLRSSLGRCLLASLRKSGLLYWLVWSTLMTKAISVAVWNLRKLLGFS